MEAKIIGGDALVVFLFHFFFCGGRCSVFLVSILGGKKEKHFVLLLVKGYGPISVQFAVCVVVAVIFGF